MHGYLADKRSFYNQINYFQRDFEVFAWDFRGFGENATMKFPYALSDYVSELKENCYKNGVTKPSCVAHSFGGRVALKLAYDDTCFFDKLVLTGCAGLKAKKTLKKRVKTFAFNLLKCILPRKKLEKFYSSDYLALNPIMRQSFIKIVNEHLDYCLSGINNPTLIINGALDKETPLYMAKKLNNDIKGSKLVVIDGAGHFAFIDKPNTFNMEVRDFLFS